MFSDIVFCKEANELGFSKVHSINLISANNQKQLRNKINKEPGLVVILGSPLNREVISNRKVDILVSPHSGIGRKDYLNSRNSGLNEILCKIARKNEVAVGLSFSEVLNSKGVDRALIIGRMMQNIVLCRKFKVQMVLASFASNESEMRAPKDLLSFGIVLGMNPGEAKKALSVTEEIINKKQLAKNIISEGIRSF